MADDGIALEAIAKSLHQVNMQDKEEEPPIDVEKKEESREERREEATVIYNTKALLKTAETYELEKFKKNAMIIFNHESIDGYPKPRLGTRKDEDTLNKTFSELGFEIDLHLDLTKKQVTTELDTFFKRDFTEYGCVVVVVMTHGSDNGVLMAKDQPYNETDILNHFITRDKPTLVTKPKMLLVQACRGTNSLNGVPVLSPGTRIQKDYNIDTECYFLPAEADMLVFHSTYYGNPAVRDIVDGSWFIQTLCKKIQSSSNTLDFLSIAVEVQKEIAIEKSFRANSRLYDEDVFIKQMPILTSSLIRKLYFRKYQEPGDTETDTKAVESKNQDVSECQRKVYQDYNPCKCYLKHFEYIKDYLVHHVEDNPDDKQAMNFLNIAKSFKNIEDFDNTKQIVLQAICQHLKLIRHGCETLKHVYLYEGQE